MVLHLISAERLGRRLVENSVSAQEQALYVSASFVIWLLPTYLLVIPTPNPHAWPIPLGLWFYEAGALVFIFSVGVPYCLARCRVEPKKNFLIDFSCLYAPVSLTTLVIVWAIYYIYASFVPMWLVTLTFDARPRILEFIYSARFFDLMRFLGIVGGTLVVIIRVGNHMERVSNMRLSANPALNADAGIRGAG
jgi:hypothetical protein